MDFLRTVLLILTFWVSVSLQLRAQDEQALVKATIEKFFAGMKTKDTTAIRQTLDASVRFQTIARNGTLKTESVDDFLKSIGTPRKEIFDERLTRFDIRVDAQIATAWTPYQFYVDDTFSHCGVNAFQLYKSADDWKIIQIIDTRRKDNCAE